MKAVARTKMMELCGGVIKQQLEGGRTEGCVKTKRAERRSGPEKPQTLSNLGELAEMDPCRNASASN